MAENGLQATQMVCSQSPDHFSVIILDINMPIMDGFQACNAIHDYLTNELDNGSPSGMPRY